MKKSLIAATALLISITACAQETIKLPTPDRAKATMSVMDALNQRQSIRSFSDRALTDDQLSLLLWAANGVNRADGRRTAPRGRPSVWRPSKRARGPAPPRR